jgi:hypothetical protein
LTGLPLGNLNVVPNITLRNTIDEWKARVGQIKSPGRSANPGEERRRALVKALDAKEIRLAEIVTTTAPDGAGQQHDHLRPNRRAPQSSIVDISGYWRCGLSCVL